MQFHDSFQPSVPQAPMQDLLHIRTGQTLHTVQCMHCCITHYIRTYVRTYVRTYIGRQVHVPTGQAVHGAHTGLPLAVPLGTACVLTLGPYSSNFECQIKLKSYIHMYVHTVKHYAWVREMARNTFWPKY